MIHQHIFAKPKPGMSEEAFHHYWLQVHAPKYASKIKQIRRYMICTRIACAGVTDPPAWNGCAEIWLRNEREQLASLQSREFLEGARRDEPRWAAFWETLGLDTEARFIPEGLPRPDTDGVKLVTLLKRRGGTTVERFRRCWAESYAPLLLEVPGVRRYLQCAVRDGAYTRGEPRFDAVQQIWFPSVEAIEAALQSTSYRHAQAHLAEMVEPAHLYSLAVKEHWIIGPKLR